MKLWDWIRMLFLVAVILGPIQLLGGYSWGAWVAIVGFIGVAAFGFPYDREIFHYLWNEVKSLFRFKN